MSIKTQKTNQECRSHHAGCMVPPFKNFLLGMLLMIPGASFAEAWVVTPSASISGTYDDNLYLTTQPHDSAKGAILAADIKYSRYTDITEISGTAHVDDAYYAGNNRLSRASDNQYISLNTKYKMELGELKLDAKYNRDSTIRSSQVYAFPTIDGQVDYTADPDVSVVDALIRRNTLELSPSWLYHLSERTRLKLQYSLRDVRYKDVPMSVALYDFDQHNLKGSIIRNLTERDSFILSLDAGLYKAPDNNNTKSNSYALSGTYNHGFTELTRGGFGIGYRRTDRTSNLIDQSDDGYLVHLYLTHRTELQQYRLDIRRDVAPSGLGDIYETSNMVFRFTQALSERMSGTLNVRAIDAKSLGTDTSNDRTYVSIEPGLRWGIARGWFLEASYTYRRRKYDDLPDAADSNAVLLTLQYSKGTLLD